MSIARVFSWLAVGVVFFGLAAAAAVLHFLESGPIEFLDYIILHPVQLLCIVVLAALATFFVARNISVD